MIEEDTCKGCREVHDELMELKNYVNTTCERRVHKDDLDKHVDKHDEEIINLHSRIDTHNTILNDRINTLMWKGIAGFVVVGASFVILYQWLNNDINKVKEDEKEYQLKVLEKLNVVDKSVNVNTIKLEWVLKDFKEMKKERRDDK